jgi:hypothetical protein
METIIPVVQYLESHFERSSSIIGLSDADLINMLSGNGGTQVDVVFYVILNREL